MKKEHNLIDNSIYLIRGAWKYDKGIFLLFAANTLVGAVSPFLGILFPRQIISELLGENRVDVLLIL